MTVRLIAATGILLLTCALPTLAQEVNEREDGVYVTERILLARPLPADAKIEIASATGLGGQLQIRTGKSDSIVVLYRKVARAESKSTAIDYIDLISVALAGRADAPVLKLRAPNPAPWAGTNDAGLIEAELTVPEGCEIEIAAQFFDVNAEGPFDAFSIAESMGRLEISKVHGRLNVATVNRRVTLNDISGDIQASTTNSSLIATGVVSLQDQARFRNEGGDIRLEEVWGAINLKNSFGRITVERFKPKGEGSYIRGTSGPIFVEIAEMGKGQLVISNRQEDIELSVPDTMAAYYNLSVGDEGVIEVSNFEFTTDLVQRDRLSLQSGMGEVDIRGSIRGIGNIYVRGRTGDSNDN